MESDELVPRNLRLKPQTAYGFALANRKNYRIIMLTNARVPPSLWRLYFNSNIHSAYRTQNPQSLYRYVKDPEKI